MGYNIFKNQPSGVIYMTDPVAVLSIKVATNYEIVTNCVEVIRKFLTCCLMFRENVDIALIVIGILFRFRISAQDCK